MKIDKVFAIFENGSDYESFPEVIGFSETKEGADKICHTLSFYYQQLLAFKEELVEITKPIYDEELECEKGLDWPRWSPGTSESNITKEMREERKEIKSKNVEIEERNRARVVAKNDKIKKAVAEKINELDDSDMSKYIKQNLSDTGGIISYLYPYTNEEINRLS